MDFYKMSVAETADKLGTDTAAGLTPAAAENAARKFGKNVLSARKPRSLIRRIFDELTEPMMLILLFALGLTLTVNITSAARGAPFDLTEILALPARSRCRWPSLSLWRGGAPKRTRR